MFILFLRLFTIVHIPIMKTCMLFVSSYTFGLQKEHQIPMLEPEQGPASKSSIGGEKSTSIS